MCCVNHSYAFWNPFLMGHIADDYLPYVQWENGIVLSRVQTKSVFVYIHFCASAYVCGSVGYVRMAWAGKSDDRLAHEFHVQLRISSSWTFDLAKIPGQSKQWKNLSHLGHTHAHISALAFLFSFYHIVLNEKQQQQTFKLLVSNLKYVCWGLKTL